MKKIIILILLVSAMFGLSKLSNASETGNSGTHHEQSEYLGDGKILIVLTREETIKFLEYTPEEFSEIGCLEVVDLTEASAVYVGQVIRGEKPEEELAINVEEFRRILLIELLDKNWGSVLRSISILESKKWIDSVEINTAFKVYGTPNDPQYINNKQWGLNKINMRFAWNIATGSDYVKVGIIDSGIDASHPDLTEQIYYSPSHSINNTLHRDFVSNTAGTPVLVPSDAKEHGTHVAGIIGASGNNGIGVTGVAQNVKLVSLKIFYFANNEYYSNVAWMVSAISYASNINLKILNISAGNRSFSAALHTEIMNYTGLVVAAAGNSDDNTDVNPIYPASLTLSNIISVGASDINDNQSDWNGIGNIWGLWGLTSQKSNYGATSVDIFAPGTGIMSTIPNNQYSNMSGTSMAAPMVTGVAALLLSHNNLLTTEKLRDAILNTTTSVASLDNLCTTGGRLNANAALRSIGYNVISNSPTSVSLEGLYFTPSDEHTIPVAINGKTVTAIEGNIITNNNSLTRINISRFVTYIGENTFKGCNNLIINFIGRASIPTGFHSNWNPDKRPISFDGIVCNHSNVTYIKYNDNYNHRIICNDCRFENVVSHVFSTTGYHSDCVCGFTICINNDHDFKYTAIIGGVEKHRIDCHDCDYYGGTQECITPHGQPGSLVYCYKCGQSIRIPF